MLNSIKIDYVKIGELREYSENPRFTKRNRSSKLLNRLTNLGLRIRYWLMRKVK